MSKKKRYPKSYLEIDGKRYSVDDLVSEVNKFDKRMGLHLKNPEIWADPSMYRQIMEAKGDNLIAIFICIINAIKIRDYFQFSDSEYGLPYKPIGIMHTEFLINSALNWIHPRVTYETDSLIFRCRFVSLVLTQMMGRISKITNREVYTTGKMLHSVDEQRIILTKELVDDIVVFIRCMLIPDTSYKNIILKMNGHLSYLRKRRHGKINAVVNGDIIQLRENMVYEPLTGGRFLSDDMAISDILNIAYILATGMPYAKVMPSFKYIEGATVKHNLIKLIEELGAQIIYHTDRKYTPMFKAFVEASPKVWSDFSDQSNKNMAIRIGIVSLEFADFVIDSHNISKFIKEMKKTGI